MNNLAEFQSLIDSISIFPSREIISINSNWFGDVWGVHLTEEAFTCISNLLEKESPYLYSHIVKDTVSYADYTRYSLEIGKVAIYALYPKTPEEV